MKNSHLQIVWVATFLIVWNCRAIDADTISINFNNGGATLLGAGDEAGFVPSTNWNNFRNNGGLGLFNPDPTPLVDSTGTEIDATISWEVGSSFFNSNNGTGNQRMMEGWFGLNEADFGNITIEDIPASYTSPTYDVYVYFDSDQIAPNERTMTFTAGDVSITGKELASNFNGFFFEASEGSVGNYVVFRDFNLPTLTLTADSNAGRASINGIQLTTEPEPDPILPPDPHDPIHVYDASGAGNLEDLWLDSVGGNSWRLAGAEVVDVTSGNTSIATAYRLLDPVQGFGGDANPFPAGNMTYEMWVRLGETNEDHQVVFETGGGQNGTSILVTDENVRLLNSRSNTRNFDIEVPLEGIDTSDFLQIVASLNATDDEITLFVNGSAGGSVSGSESGPVGRGGNRASLFTWGSGLGNVGDPRDQGGGTFNLGGRTELDDMTPDGLTQFAGEIGLLNVFTRAFTPEEVQAAFAALTSAGIPGDYNRDGMLDVLDLNLQADAIASGDLAFDENGDGQVNYDDRLIWVKDHRFTWIGDANLDGEFESSDFVEVFIAGKFETGQEADWSQGDWNGDKLFDTSDFVVAFQDGGFEMGLRQQVRDVPEPNSFGWTLLISAAFVVLRICKKAGVVNKMSTITDSIL